MVPYSTCLGVLCALAASCALAQPDSSWNLGNGHRLTWKSNPEQLSIIHSNRTVLNTVPGRSFLSASSGMDNIVGTNGNFKISNIDHDKCQGQNVTNVFYNPRHDSISNKEVSINGYLLSCGSQDVKYSMRFWVPSRLPNRVAFDVNVEPGRQTKAPLEKIYLTLGSDASEDFYGLGAQGSFASMKNQSIPIFSREQGVGRGDQPITSIEDSQSFFSGGDRFTTYTAIPQYISTAGRLFYLEEKDTAYTVFNFHEPTAVTIRYSSRTVSGHFALADTMMNAITMLMEYTGRMPTLPEWVDHGAILGIQGGQEKVNRVVNQGFEQNCPIAGIWLQDWSGTHFQSAPYGNANISRLWWNWESDSVLYPTWNEFVQTLREKHNVRTLTYINPFIANVSLKDDGYRRNLFLEATKGRYMIQNATTNSTSIVSSGKGLDAGILDITNDKARAWFAKVLHDNVWSANISGVMWDFGEYTPITDDSKLVGASDALFYHNQYPRDWAVFQRSVAEKEPLFHEMVTFHRSASLGANRHMNLFWAGDQTTVWSENDGIKSAVTIMGQMGISGYAYSHSDIGGYTTAFKPPKLKGSSGAISRTAELLGRWGELAAVSSPVFRSHEGNVPEVNTQFYTDSSTYSYFAYNARLFRSLGPYRRKTMNTESKHLGWPLLRMPVLYHSDDPKAREISYQSFYLGQDLFVAPVLDAGRKTLDVYFPGTDKKRAYTHVWSGKTYHAGQTVRVAAPYGKPPVFIVGNANSPELDVFLDFVRKENDTIIHV